MRIKFRLVVLCSLLISLSMYYCIYLANEMIEQQNEKYYQSDNVVYKNNNQKLSSLIQILEKALIYFYYFLILMFIYFIKCLLDYSEQKNINLIRENQDVERNLNVAELIENENSKSLKEEILKQGADKKMENNELNESLKKYIILTKRSK